MHSTTAISGKERVAAPDGAAAIRSDAQLTKATHELCALMAGGDLSPDEEKRFRELLDSVEKYEATHYPIPEPSHAALLDHLLDARKMTPVKLARATGIAQANIRAILAGDRDISTGEAKLLAKCFRVDGSVFENSAPFVRVRVVTSSAGGAGFRVFGLTFALAKSAAQAADLSKQILSLVAIPQPHQKAPVPFRQRFGAASV